MNFKEFYEKNRENCEKSGVDFDILENCCDKINLNGEKFEKFERHLVESNSKYNLTAICEHDDILIKHFFDSLLGERYFEKNANAVEVGSGAGFPSVPLLIAREDIKFTLIESTGKKCRFLEEVAEILALNARVVNERCEVAVNNLREKFDVCVARAVAKLNTLLEYCLPFVKVGGRFIAYKTSEEELDGCDFALSELGGEVEKVESFDFEGLGKRTLIIIKKVKKTPLKYPRGRGLERKKPL